jgi:hypothetical protein
MLPLALGGGGGGTLLLIAEIGVGGGILRFDFGGGGGTLAGETIPETVLVG